MSASPTVGSALDRVAHRLRDGGVEAPRGEARLLVERALGLSREAVVANPERVLSGPEHRTLEALATRRAGREPMAYLLGEREFWSLPFAVTPATLIPRPDSEVLIEAALEWIGDRAARIEVLDLGTGGGCLMLALLSELSHAMGVGVDASHSALRVARRNAERLGLADRVRFLCADWGEALVAPFDLILVNPPYVADPEAGRLDPEISAHEPREALSGGADGLACFRALAPHLARLLAPSGRAFVEVGAGQIAKAGAIFSALGLEAEGTRRDLGGVERCLTVRCAKGHGRKRK